MYIYTIYIVYKYYTFSMAMPNSKLISGSEFLNVLMHKNIYDKLKYF